MKHPTRRILYLLGLALGLMLNRSTTTLEHWDPTTGSTGHTGNWLGLVFPVRPVCPVVGTVPGSLCFDLAPTAPSFLSDYLMPQTATKVPTGLWGGEHIGLEVTATGANLSYDCANGSIDQALTLDRQGNFGVKGVHIKGRPGPVRGDERPAKHPARYTGSLDGQTMTLKLTLTDTGETIGVFTLTYGKEPRLRRCL